MLAVGSNPSIPLLNVATGSTKVMLELAGRHSPVMGVQFSGDGQSLYHICFDPLVLTFNSNFFPVTSTYSNLLTAKFLIDTSYISTPQFQNIGTISTLRFFPSNSGWYLESEKCTPLLDIALSQNGSWLLSAFHSYQQAIFSMRIGIPTVTHYGSYDGVHGTLMRRDVKSNAIYYPLYPKKFNEMPTPGIMDSTCRAAFSVAMTGDTSMYITSENQLTVICKGQQYSQGYICLTDSSPYWLFVKDIATGRELRRYRDSSKCIRLSPDGFHILTRSGLWDVFAGTLVQKLDIGDLDRFEYLPDGVHVAAFFGGDSAAVRIFDIQKNQYVFSFGRLPNKARCMAVSPDGKYIALGLEQNNVALVEVPTFPVMKNNVNFALPMFGNPAENQAVRFVNATLPANENFTFAWNFGDGTTSAERSPNHSFAAAGHYNVTLTAYRNGVSAGSITKAVEVKAVSGVAEDAASSLRIEPNPAGESFSVRCAGETPSKATLYDALGNVIAASGFSCAAGECLARFDTSLLASGAYYCVVTAGNSLRALPVRVAR